MTTEPVNTLPADDKTIQESLKARIAGKDMILYQAPHESPVGIDLPFVRWLTTKEQPWYRRGLATPEWKRLECGWLAEGASLMVIVNREGHFKQVQPTPESRAVAEAKVLEIGIMFSGRSSEDDYVQGFCLVPVRDSLRLTPDRPDGYYIRCPSGPAEYDLRLYPL